MPKLVSEVTGQEDTWFVCVPSSRVISLLIHEAYEAIRRRICRTADVETQVGSGIRHARLILAEHSGREDASDPGRMSVLPVYGRNSPFSLKNGRGSLLRCAMGHNEHTGQEGSGATRRAGFSIGRSCDQRRPYSHFTSLVFAFVS